MCFALDLAAAARLSEPVARGLFGLRPRYARLLVALTGHAALAVRKRAFSTLGGWTPGAEEEIASAVAAVLGALEAGDRKSVV